MDPDGEGMFLTTYNLDNLIYKIRGPDEICTRDERLYRQESNACARACACRHRPARTTWLQVQAGPGGPVEVHRHGQQAPAKI